MNQMFVMENGNEMYCRCLSCGLSKSRKMIKRHVESHLDGAFEHKCNNCGKTFDRLYKLMFPRYHPCHLKLSIIDDDHQKYPETQKIDSIVNEFSLALTDSNFDQSMQSINEVSDELQDFGTIDKSFNKDEVKGEPLESNLTESYKEKSKNYERDLRRRIFSSEYFQEYDKKLLEICERLDKQVFRCKVCGKIA